MGEGGLRGVGPYSLYLQFFFWRLPLLSKYSPLIHWCRDAALSGSLALNEIGWKPRKILHSVYSAECSVKIMQHLQRSLNINTQHSAFCSHVSRNVSPAAGGLTTTNSNKMLSLAPRNDQSAPGSGQSEASSRITWSLSPNQRPRSAPGSGSWQRRSNPSPGPGAGVDTRKCLPR